MRLREGIKLDFDDVLIEPQRSALESRADVDLARTYKFPHSKRIWTGIGLIAANMDTTGTFEMAKALAGYKLFTALHKHYTEEQLIEFFDKNEELWDYVFYTVGSSDDDYGKLFRVKKALALKRSNGSTESQTYHHYMREFPKFLNIDVANGYLQSFIDVVKEYRATRCGESVILAGNICTPNMTEELILSGADIAKVGIGGGSVCISRVVAGVGFPQLSAIDECSYAAHGKPHGHVCSDGGCRTPGDVAKAMASGADLVMLGGMFAGTDQCSGEWEYNPEWIDGENGVPRYTGKQVKSALKFYGMSSKDAQIKYNGGLSPHRASEGKTVKVPYKGDVSVVVQDILGGLRSACTYSGASKLKDLPKCASFVRVNSTHNKVFGK